MHSLDATKHTLTSFVTIAHVPSPLLAIIHSQAFIPGSIFLIKSYVTVKHHG
jgi:hypothetical protein